MAEEYGVLLERMDGKLQRILDAQKRQGEDIKEVREVQNAQRDKLAALSSLNIQERFVSVNREQSAFDERLKILELMHAAQQGERKGVEISAKVIYAFVAVGGLGILAFIFRTITGVI